MDFVRERDGDEPKFDGRFAPSLRFSVWHKNRANLIQFLTTEAQRHRGTEKAKCFSNPSPSDLLQIQGFLRDSVLKKGRLVNSRFRLPFALAFGIRIELS